MTAMHPTSLRSLAVPVSTWNPLNPARKDDSFVYVDLSAVDQELKAITGARTLPCVEAPSRARQVLKAKDVLVSTVRPNLNAVALVSDELDGATASTGFCVIRANPERLEPRFVFHWVRTSAFVSSMVRQATGASYPAVSDRVVLDSQLPLPSLADQRRIAAILDKADGLRTKRSEALMQLDRIARSSFAELFGDLYANTKAFPVKPLGDVCDVRDGTHDSPSYVHEGYPLVTSKNLKNGTIDLTDAKFISQIDYNEINRRSKVDVGDILMPMIGTIGNPALVCEEPAFAIKNMALIKFKPDSPSRNFVLHFLRSEFFDKLVASKNKGGTQKFLALGDIRGLPLPLPPIETQREFAKLLFALEAVRKNSCTSQELSNALFSALQDRAFRGEL